MSSPRFLSTLVIATALAGAAPAAAEPVQPSRPALTAGSATRNAVGYSVAGPDGARFSVPGGPVVVAEPGAQLRVLPIPQPLTLGGGGSVAGYTVVLRAGAVSLSVPKGSSSALVLAAPHRVSAIVQSGTAHASAAAGRTAVSSAEGVTTLSTGSGGYRPLAPGRVQIVEAGKTSVRDAVAAPAQLHGPRVVFTPEASARLGTLRWEPVPGAVEYRAELRREADGVRVLEQRTREPALTLDEPLPRGRYRLALTAVDDAGLVSATSLERAVRVVGVELPRGAYSDASGTLFVGPGQEVELVHAEGLEVTQGRSARFVPAGRKVRLFRDEPTALLFRLPDGAETVSLRLAPRTLKADIEISPRTATWPQDPIDIRYRVVDGAGGAPPAWLEPRARVLLGLQPLDVKFVREGSWHRARVSPRAGSGPWVLRVEVEDQNGVPLGRDFLEVVRGGGAPSHTVVVQRRIDRTARR